MDDLFDNMFNDLPLDPLMEEDGRPLMLQAFNSFPDDPPFLLDDGIIPENDDAIFGPPPPRKRRFMDHRTSIFTIFREAPEKEVAPNHNKFLAKRRRAVALRLNAQSSSDNTKAMESPQAPPPRVIKKIEQKMRNRISAQNSRDRKKGYVNILERQNADLRKENKNLKDELEALQDEIAKMREKCALSTAESGSKASHQNNKTLNNGNSSQSSNNGSQNPSNNTMSEEGNQSGPESEAVFQDQEENMQRHSMSGNSLFLSLFSVLSVCAMIAMTSGPDGMHADGLHAQAERLRVLAAMQPRCANYAEQTTQIQAMYDKIHKLKNELNASKIEKSKQCIEPEAKQCPSQLNNTNSAPSLNKTAEKSKNFLAKKEGSTNYLRSWSSKSSTAVVEYSKSQTNMAHNSTNSTGTLFCPSGVIVSNVIIANETNMGKKEPQPIVPLGSYEALKTMFGQESLVQIILPTANLTTLRPKANGQSEITQFGNKEDKLVEMLCVVKGIKDVS